MSKTRSHIPIESVRMLRIETGNKCSLPTCPHETGLDVHHIDGDPGNNEFENLLLLCAIHHRHATKGSLDKKACMILKGLLAIPKISDRSTVKDLQSRLVLVQTALSLLRESKSYRSTIIGPLFLHPESYAKQRNRFVQIPNYDASLQSYIMKYSDIRCHNIRIILTNRDRYRKKIEKYITNSEKGKFQENLLRAVNDVWGENFEKGPDICCANTGFFEISMIYDDQMISTFRAAPQIPTEGGILYKDEDVVQRFRARFDTIFNGISRGQENEVKSLVSFIKNLW